MTIQKILEESVVGDAKIWVDELRLRLLQGIEYPKILWVNKLVNQLSEEQEKVLKSKFKGIDDVLQMHDKLAEVFTARKFMKDKPVFLSDNRNPDIYLRKQEEYVEVKRINLSDEELSFQEEISRNSRAGLGATTGSSMILTEKAKKEKLQPLFKKTKELIDKGEGQLKGKNGFIHLFYSVDSMERYGINPKICEVSVWSFIEKYSSTVGIKIVYEKYSLLNSHQKFWKKIVNK